MLQRQGSELAAGRDDVSSSSIVYPIEFSKWSKGARRLWKFLTGLPSWRTGWASPSDERLREQWEYSDRRPIQRARRELVKLGELEYRQIRRGEPLPNGTRARYRHWIYVEGRAMLARRAGECAEKSAPQDPIGTDTASKTHQDSAILAHRFDLKERSDLNSLSPELPPDTPSTERTSADRSDQLSLRSSQKSQIESPVDVATSVLACHVAKHFVAATGLGWQSIHPEVIDVIVPILDGMHGDGPSRIARACRVIDSVVREATEAGARMPTVRYIFHRELFWKRLGDLDNPVPKPLGRPALKSPSLPEQAPLAKAPAPTKAPAPKGIPRVPPPRPDILTPSVPAWLREAIGAATPASSSAAFSDDEIAELRALESAARSRSG